MVSSARALRFISPDDYPWILALNSAHETQTSPLDLAQLSALDAMSYRATAAGHAAFLMSFDAHAAYASQNYRWFVSRFVDFIYVDRIIVAPAARGLGLARLLYQDLFDAAAAAGSKSVVCEVNSMPANPASDVFHAQMGFQRVGSATLTDSGKIVQYLQRLL